MVVATKATGTFTRGEGEIVKLVERGQLLVQAALKALSMFGAPASLELIDDNPHAASIVDR
jgi:hypothetical protein